QGSQVKVFEYPTDVKFEDSERSPIEHANHCIQGTKMNEETADLVLFQLRQYQTVRESDQPEMSPVQS
ncbi:hypothetical protein H0H93_005223, partial [Arthromyces matolae]